jgi:hypothetical protein
MIHTADGSFRYSPSDLVAYLEGDFAAWCERMAAERWRAGGTAASTELEWATPDEDEESALAAQKGDEHERRFLLVMKERKPGLIEINRDDPTRSDRTLAAIRSGPAGRSAPRQHDVHRLRR